MAPRSSASWRTSAPAIASRCVSQRAVEPSMSVKRKVRMPVGGMGHLSNSQEGCVDKLMRHGTTTSALVTPRQAYAGDPAVVGTIAVGCDRGAGNPRNRPSTLRSSSTSGQ